MSNILHRAESTGESRKSKLCKPVAHASVAWWKQMESVCTRPRVHCPTADHNRLSVTVVRTKIPLLLWCSLADSFPILILVAPEIRTAWVTNAGPVQGYSGNEVAGPREITLCCIDGKDRNTWGPWWLLFILFYFIHCCVLFVCLFSPCLILHVVLSSLLSFTDIQSKLIPLCFMNARNNARVINICVCHGVNVTLLMLLPLFYLIASLFMYVQRLNFKKNKAKKSFSTVRNLRNVPSFA